MTKQNRSGANNLDKPEKIRATVTIHGLSVDIPAELDLPAGAPFEGRDRPATMQIPEDIKELFGPLIEMATNAWRLKVRMVDPDSGEPKEDTRKLYRFVEGLFRALDDAGIQVIDKSGKPYDSGMPEKVISFEQTPGLLKEEVIQTVRPSIRWKERSLRHGEIIVGIPVIENPPEELPKTEVISIPNEVPAEAPQPAEVATSPPGQYIESPDPEKSESSEALESDVAASDGQPVAAQADSGPVQPDAATSGSRSGKESQCDVADSQSTPTGPKDAPDNPVESTTPNKPDTP